MNIEEIRLFCLSLTDATESLPFGPDNVVFKVNNKMFALLNLVNGNMNLKCNPEQAIELREQYTGVIPGYHMNKVHWNTILPDGSVSKALLIQFITNSYNLVLGK